MKTLKEYLQRNSKKYVIFDLDETILTLVLPWDMWEKNIEKQLIDIDQNILKEYKSNKISLNEMQNLYAKKGAALKDMLNNNNYGFETRNLKNVVLNQALIDFVKNTKDCKFFIWTSNSHATAKRTLEKAGILEKFEKIVACEDVLLLKPDPEGFYVLWDKNVPKNQYLFIGDSTNDAEAAKNAGIDFFTVDSFTDTH